jgi:hypothetical protein
MPSKLLKSFRIAVQSGELPEKRPVHSVSHASIRPYFASNHKEQERVRSEPARPSPRAGLTFSRFCLGENGGGCGNLLISVRMRAPLPQP